MLLFLILKFWHDLVWVLSFLRCVLFLVTAYLPFLRLLTHSLFIPGNHDWTFNSADLSHRTISGFTDSSMYLPPTSPHCQLQEICSVELGSFYISSELFPSGCLKIFFCLLLVWSILTIIYLWVVLFKVLMFISCWALIIISFVHYLQKNVSKHILWYTACYHWGCVLDDFFLMLGSFYHDVFTLMNLFFRMI